MKTKTLVIGAIAVTAALAGGWALAQSVGPPRGFGQRSMHGQGSDGMGPGMMKGMRHGMGSGMMEGMDHRMGHGAGMMEGMHDHGPGMIKGMGTGMMYGRPEAALPDPAHLDALKGELGIATAQEAAWSKYTRAVGDAATAMKTARESLDPTVVSRMTPAERFAFVSKTREQEQKQSEVVRTAANELLAVLDDTQKAKAAGLLPGLARSSERLNAPKAVAPFPFQQG